MRRNIKKRLPLEVVTNKLDSMGLYLYQLDCDKSICDQKFSVYDNQGYYYEVYWSSISKNHYPSKFYNTNPFTIQNINHYLTLERNGEYVCISKKYIGNTDDLIFIHLPCMKKFTSNLAAMKGKRVLNGETYYKQCPHCKKFLIESRHASVLKQIFIHEHPDTSTEDKTCINPNTNRCLPTDIVNHRLKIAIEIQSDFHDDEERKKIDLIKKEFWTNKGYSFYDPDIRDYKVLEMVQLFFPKINKIPNYIDYNYSIPTNPKEVQALLNRGKTIKEVANELNITIHVIHNMISSGSVVLPENSKCKAKKIKSLIHLTKNGEFIKEYNHLNDVSKDNYALGTIQRVLKGKQKFAYDSYWVYGEDYYNNNYSIPKDEPDKYLVSVYSIKGDEIKHYSDIYTASKEIGCYPYEIYNILQGKRKHVKEYTFKYNVD